MKHIAICLFLCSCTGLRIELGQSLKQDGWTEKEVERGVRLLAETLYLYNIENDLQWLPRAIRARPLVIGTYSFDIPWNEDSKLLGFFIWPDQIAVHYKQGGCIADTSILHEIMHSALCAPDAAHKEWECDQAHAKYKYWTAVTVAKQRWREVACGTLVHE